MYCIINKMYQIYVSWLKYLFIDPPQEAKITSPDYKGENIDDAVKDFNMRIKHYKDMYEPLEEEGDKHLSFIRIFNQGEKYLVNRVHGKHFTTGGTNTGVVSGIPYSNSHRNFLSCEINPSHLVFMIFNFAQCI